MKTKLEQALVLVNCSDISEVILEMKCESRGGDLRDEEDLEKIIYKDVIQYAFQCVCVCMCAFVRRSS
jgi:hypothetical protein